MMRDSAFDRRAMPMFVGIATSGRKAILEHAIGSVQKQEMRPDLLVVCVPAAEDMLLKPDNRSPRTVVLHAQKGSCTQRNAILDYLASERGILLIIDDDFILHKSYLRRLQRLLADNDDIAILNGIVAADGIIGPGLSIGEAETVLSNVAENDDRRVAVEDCASIYGCNMAINLERVGPTRFDENLPLYGWQEDVDFSAQLKARGRVVKANIVAGVHLGVKLGRTAGLKFGFSQVVNPAYLVRKGTMKINHAVGLIARNITMNIARSISPEPYIDRRGRLRGNLKGIAEIVCGRIDPRSVTKI